MARAGSIGEQEAPVMIVKVMSSGEARFDG